MNSDTADRSRRCFGRLRAFNIFVTALICALVVACVSPPPTPAPPAPALTRAERIGAALIALDFEQRDDGYHLTLPAPLIFPFDSDVVATGAREALLRVGRELRDLGIDRTLVHGHTDNVGSNEYNLALSKRRADAVAKVLVDGRYPADKIDVKGFASGVPVAENTTPEGRSKNRRVVIVVQLM